MSDNFNFDELKKAAARMGEIVDAMDRNTVRWMQREQCIKMPAPGLKPREWRMRVGSARYRRLNRDLTRVMDEYINEGRIFAPTFATRIAVRLDLDPTLPPDGMVIECGWLIYAMLSEGMAIQRTTPNDEDHEH